MNNKFLTGDLITLGAICYFSYRFYDVYDKGNSTYPVLYGIVVLAIIASKIWELRRRGVV
ncbi:MAG: hypothetical protein RL757_1352 [Bacteroidota bacterium]|jgi:hypothetical protein